MIKILIVEDEKPISDLIKLSLGKVGYTCFCAYDGTGLVLKLAIAAFEKMEMPDIEELEREVSSVAKTLAVYYDLDFALMDQSSAGEQYVWNMIYEYGDEGIRIRISFSDYGVVINDAYREDDAMIIVN